MILLTGATGVIGRALLKYFLSIEKELVVLTRNREKLVGIKSGVVVEEGNMSDSLFLEQIFHKHKIEIVIHCAWDGVVGSSRNSSNQLNNFLEINNLFDIAGNSGIKKFIGFGSQAEYGVHNKRITEDFRPQPNSLYGLCKLSAGLLGKLKSEQYGFSFAWLRLFATYGPNDNFEFVIPYTINNLLNGREPKLSSCEQYWDYLYLEDIPMIVEKILDKRGHFNEVYNLSSGKSRRLKDIILLISGMVESSVDPKFGAISNNNDLTFLEGANDKLMKDYKIGELTDLEKGLTLTVEWYKNNRST